MGFAVKRQYFEACTCDVSCPCIWNQPATQDGCDLLLAWHVTEGAKDGTDLSGMNAVMAVRSPKQMTDGGWRVALYLDDRANAEQSDALGAVFSGGAGGYLAGLAPLIGEVAGVAPATITFDQEGRTFKACGNQPGSCLRKSGDRRHGRRRPIGDQQPVVGGRHPAAFSSGAGRHGGCHDHWDSEYQGTNSFVTDFAALRGLADTAAAPRLERGAFSRAADRDLARSLPRCGAGVGPCTDLSWQATWAPGSERWACRLPVSSSSGS